MELYTEYIYTISPQLLLTDKHVDQTRQIDLNKHFTILSIAIKLSKFTHIIENIYHKCAPTIAPVATNFGNKHVITNLNI